jgi:hypothetical protein
MALFSNNPGHTKFEVVFLKQVILTLTILWKGSPNLGLAEMPIPDLMAAVFGTGKLPHCFYFYYVLGSYFYFSFYSLS